MGANLTKDRGGFVRLDSRRWTSFDLISSTILDGVSDCYGGYQVSVATLPEFCVLHIVDYLRACVTSS